MPERCDILDRGFASLVADLERRGLLSDTLIVLASGVRKDPAHQPK
ncbi:MAG: hypothetical protein R3F31_14135 [Verrucomicrobiales bacterium]